MNPYPALIVCGPPHAGKSTLCHALTMALREAGVAHYLFRAAPDGEGNWTSEAPPEAARALRKKGPFDQTWLAYAVGAVASRQLPFIVDMGGRPTLEQENLLDQCQYAIVLTCDAAQHEEWLERVRRHALHIIADLRSELDAADEVTLQNGRIEGVIGGLRQDRVSIQQPALAAVLAQVRERFTWRDEDVAVYHATHTPWPAGSVEIIDFDGLLRARGQAQFHDSDRDAITASLADRQPIALYGRLWSHLVVALAKKCDVRAVFMADQGWVAPTRVRLIEAPRCESESMSLAVQVEPGQRATLRVTKLQPYLPYVDTLDAPAVPAGFSLMIDGKLPSWLLAGLATAYAGCASLSILDPRNSTTV
ncbi:MAG: hypothetical protein K1X39_11285 [Thermoflexales bacterium]|nr:hypothetical protein [Thermoflexales bacterium]